MSDSKIVIKVGIVEFSGEGEKDWLSAQLDKILVKIPDLLRIEMSYSNDAAIKKPLSNAKQNQQDGKALNLSMVNIATKIKAKSGGEVATAAAAYLKLVKEKDSFSREEILAAMKLATGIYKTSYNNNLSNILLTLVNNDTLTQSAGNAYSLSFDKEEELYGQLAK